MYIRFWGTRGSIATPGQHTAKYGGNTSCVEVRAADGTLIILDCGTGARDLGLHLLRSTPQPMRIHLFIGHTHWDHIQGFPFFLPAFHPETEMNIYAPVGFQRGLEEAMAGQMQYSYFPVKLYDLHSRLDFTELEEGFFRVGEVLVETQYLNHTAPTIAYRLSSDGATVAYVTDHEPFWKPSGPVFQHPGDQRHVAFLKGADFIIHDAQYSTEEYHTKIGWGHSTIEYAINVALAAGVSRLALFHHDPMHDDATMERMEAEARAHVAARGANLEVFAAAEGLELEVHGNGSAHPKAEVSALRHRSIAGRQVMVVSANEDDLANIGQVLAEDGLVMMPISDKRTALARVREISPDLVIITQQLPHADGRTLIRPLRSRLGRSDLPIILLTDNTDTQDSLRSGATAPTDYLAKPFSPPMLRTRIRAWLARTLRADSARRSTRSHRGTASLEVPERLPSEEDAGVLASVPLLQPLTPEQLHILAAHATEHIYPEGHVVVRQGDPGDKLFVVLSGRVRIVEAPPDNPQVELFLGELGHGEIFGELGILRDQLRSATVVAIERTHCLVLPHSDFLQVLQSSPDLSVALLKVLTRRLHDADRLLARNTPDLLTGLIGRRAFHDQYQRLAAGARRRRNGVVLMVLDVLHLKTINDRFGYSVGDDVLRGVADALREATRTTDLVARNGGDEFAVLLMDAGPKDIEPVMGRVQAKLRGLVTQRGLPMAVQCSIGVAISSVPPESADELFREADQDMHHKKRE